MPRPVPEWAFSRRGRTLRVKDRLPVPLRLFPGVFDRALLELPRLAATVGFFLLRIGAMLVVVPDGRLA